MSRHKFRRTSRRENWKDRRSKSWIVDNFATGAGLPLSLSLVFISGAKTPGFSNATLFVALSLFFHVSPPSASVLSRGRLLASPWRQRMAHGTCNTISLLAKNEKVWRVLLHWAVRGYTRYIKRFSSGISVLSRAHSPTSTNEKKKKKKERKRGKRKERFLWNSCVFVCGFITGSRVITFCFLVPRIDPTWNEEIWDPRGRRNDQRRKLLFPSWFLSPYAEFRFDCNSVRIHFRFTEQL